MWETHLLGNLTRIVCVYIYMCVCVPFITDRHYMTLYIIIVDMF
jgi:hypothetical protein